MPYLLDSIPTNINVSMAVQVRNQMTLHELDAALDFLSSEGHIYSTVDDDHFKDTEGD